MRIGPSAAAAWTGAQHEPDGAIGQCLRLRMDAPVAAVGDEEIAEQEKGRGGGKGDERETE